MNIINLARRMKRYTRNHRTRTRLQQQIAAMSRRELDRLTLDLGIPKTVLVREIKRPFWSMGE
ncbi:MAG TPA: hypothetical protein VFN01_13515 [Marinobacter sp.]|uniref:hypothetical protein n=1 Tax=Marinobacter sp. TaxID=50741 RepID=UPI002D7E9B76|nr:hypothetical protein [Marinobacter sp.]HET8802186.1 hypothetical protein [Marinobacter sp.]